MPVFQTPLTGRRFPEPVFLPQYGTFRFLEVEFVDSPQMGSFIERLSTLADGSTPAEPQTVTDATLWWDSSQQWAICAERVAQIAVFACTRRFQSSAAQAFRDCGVCPLNANDALDLMAHLWPDRASKVQFADRLLAGYGGEADEAYLATNVALDLLDGRVGVIEASRFLQGLCAPFDSPTFLFHDFFLRFDDDWVPSPERGAQMNDQNETYNARIEIMYRDDAVKVCRELVEKSLYTKNRDGAHRRSSHGQDQA